MTSFPLLPHQTALVSTLAGDDVGPGQMLLVAPPGTGAQAAIAAAAQRLTDSGKLVVIVTYLGLVADQWVSVLADLGVEEVSVVKGGSELRAALARGKAAWPESGVIVATANGLARGSIARKVELAPDLLVLDAVAQLPAEMIEPLLVLSSSAKSTLLRAHATAPRWFDGSSTVVWEAKAVDPTRRDRYGVELETYVVDPVERELILRGASFLAEVSDALRLEDPSRYGVHRRLQRLESYPRAEQADSSTGAGNSPVELSAEQRQRLNDLLNQFDDLSEDPKLELLRELVLDSRDGSGCVVVVDTLVELGYVLAYLLENVGGDIRELTGRIDPVTVAEVRESLAEGALVVASAGMIENGEALPDGTWNIWWSNPSTSVAAQARLGMGFRNSGIRVKLLREEPPFADQPLVIDVLLGL